MNSRGPNSTAVSKRDCGQQLVYESSSTTLVDIAVRLNNVGVACVESKDFADAEVCFQRALAKTNATATSLNGSSVSKRIGSKQPTSDSYVFQREEYDEGMGAFSDPVNIDTASRSELTGSDIEATIFYNVGQLSIKMGDNENALESFCLALKALRWHNSSRKSRAHDMIAIAILHNIGHLQYRSGLYDDAIKTYSRALQVARQSAHKLNLEVASSLNCLGVLYFHQPKNKSGNSMNVLVESLAIRRAVLGSDHEDVATTLNNLGRVHYMKGEFAIALTTYHEALRIRRLLLGNDHLDVGATVYNTGTLYERCFALP